MLVHKLTCSKYNVSRKCDHKWDLINKHHVGYNIDVIMVFAQNRWHNNDVLAHNATPWSDYFPF